MQAVLLKDHTLSLTQCPCPQVSKADDVLIRVSAAGLCRTDMYVAQGLVETGGPRIPGHEFSGIVQEAGPGVHHVKAGDFVAVMPVFGHFPDYSMLGVHHDGGFAESVVVPGPHVYPVPESLSREEAAYLEPVAASLAVLGAPITSEQRGVIYGDNRIAELTRRILQYRGFRNVTVRAAAKENPLELNHYDYAIETSATQATLQHLAEAVRPGGLIVLKSRPHRSVLFPVLLVVQKQIRLVGAYYGNFQEAIGLLAARAIEVEDLFGPSLPLRDAVNVLSGRTPMTDDKKIFFIP